MKSENCNMFGVSVQVILFCTLGSSYCAEMLALLFCF